ncbi:MAG TPA: hypothetical protein VFX97_16950 [Pyrinomonadaceae bacterium]|nr:hypothetical protein [Pyrinomonadaceae bacterium]
MTDINQEQLPPLRIIVHYDPAKGFAVTPSKDLAQAAPFENVEYTRASLPAGEGEAALNADGSLDVLAAEVSHYYNDANFEAAREVLHRFMVARAATPSTPVPDAVSAERKPHREICSVCGEVSRVMFGVPNEVWELVVHHSQLRNIICLRCFTRLADERGVEWDKDITFQPVSRITVDCIVTETGHPEDSCKKCGRPNVVWFAPNDLWNRYVRDTNEPGILCPVCFIQIVERGGVSVRWSVAPAPDKGAPDFVITAEWLAEFEKRVTPDINLESEGRLMKGGNGNWIGILATERDAICKALKLAPDAIHRAAEKIVDPRS